MTFSSAELSAFQLMTGRPTYLASSRKYWLATVSLHRANNRASNKFQKVEDYAKFYNHRAFSWLKAPTRHY